MPSKLTLYSYVAVFVLGLFVGSCGAVRLFPGKVPVSSGALVLKPEGRIIEERSRTITKRDTLRKTEPTVTIRYLRDTLVVRDTVTVLLPPTLSDHMYAVGTNPVHVGREAVTLTRWDAREARWEQLLYALPERRWEAFVGYRWRPGAPEAKHIMVVGGALIRGRLTTTAQLGTDLRRIYPEIGLRLRLTP